MAVNLDELRFNEQGLIPAIIQDVQSKMVLMMAYMNRESLHKTIETGETWFWSRSRQELWHKGATSGHRQKVKELYYDCDQDTLLIMVEPLGPACHRGTYSCFDRIELEPSSQQEMETHTANQPGGLDYTILTQLIETIAQRDEERPEGAYTTYLFEKGLDKILKKVGEEASEVIIAAKNRDPEELRNEAADLLYHLLVLLREQQLGLDRVLDVLRERHGK
ncbi:phosphoribosyl-ATP pyrophosphohydrolase/phosphoribosyl-AMP cyclohydrolase [Caldalkalibacillus uzonensis]|uniref:Histidine biosynthesis bifunctional protein HisIE n=1 Tax=Caldalkalibacillus uzonensis TaxID=353224 RepID=A0ABU0CXG5_9BACI|nr:bifunctional phosphoribosyl-AMP cyclohydrolase/phosphoribosyl-ATP diphosphatase HisIE [Caldalkalibacillus uzonensis]MDQ0340849.1 phosphoribosyl-ATP pyrophosphohydrolase/phosphoribosyl-AMP cyclohydrolase [Caldalkalibacillus uzonensis]